MEISGEVTLDHAPLDSGSIRFTSVGSEKRSTAGAMIKDGTFRIPQEKGLLPGTYQLEINSPDTEAPQVVARDTPGGPGILVAPDRIPSEYNVDSKQTIEVTADGENHFTFDIVSQASG